MNDAALHTDALAVDHAHLEQATRAALLQIGDDNFLYIPRREGVQIEHAVDGHVDQAGRLVVLVAHGRMVYARAMLLGHPTATVIAALRPHLLEGRAARIDAVIAGRLVGVECVLEDLHDPHNAGAALRSCESMGVQRVSLVTSVNGFRTSPRVTQGAEKWLDVKRFSDAASCARALHDRGVRLLAAIPGGRLSLEAIDPAQPVALAFGNEHTGLSPQLQELADDSFGIPMHGFSQSLNVSVSVAVSLHVTTEARRRAIGRATDLDQASADLLRARYYAMDVRKPEAMIARYLREAG